MAEKELFEINGGIAATLEAELSLFTGTTHYFENFLGLLYTDGIKYLAERAKAYWLIDAIASRGLHLRMLDRELHKWELRVDASHRAELTVRHFDCKTPFARQPIPYTDFPLRFIELYVERGILFLPSEQ